MGIADSRGIIHDFQGPYYLEKGRFMTGYVRKYYPIPPSQLEELLGPSYATKYDAAVCASDAHYSQTMHNLCCNNCHHHVASALTGLGWPITMVQTWWLVTSRGRYVSAGAWWATFLPFFVLLAIIGLLILVIMLS
jgi:hypothetical protein